MPRYRLATMLFDYTTVDVDSVESGIDKAIAAAEAIIDKVVAPTTEATFENILQPLDEVDNVLGQANASWAFMGYVHPVEEVRDAGRVGEEKLQSFGIDLAFREDLYQAICDFAETEEADRLEGEKARLLTFIQRDLRRAGHELAPDQRAALKERSQRMVELGVRFQQNIDDSDNTLLLERGDLEGLPDAYIDSLETDDESGKLKLTMAYPHIIPFMDNAARRDLRKQASFLFNTRAVGKNRPILDEMIRLRQEIADIFEVPSWAHHVLEERMAKTPERVEEFYESLVPQLTAQGEKDVAAMIPLLEADTGDDQLQLWDWRYYDTLQRKTDYGVDQYEVAKYLPLDRILAGLFELTSKTFGLTYEEVAKPKAWHPDVSLHAVLDSETGELLAHFYLDLFPREGKFSHAAEFPMIGSRRLPEGTYQNPACAMVANFTKPTTDAPSLLQHAELETLFHEFGHVLHQNLGRTEMGRFSGTNVERDFVEAPSQIMQHWVWRSDVLRRFARHYQTAEVIPDDLVNQLVAARRLNTAVQQLRQVQFGLLDARLHGPGTKKDLNAIARATSDVSLMPFHEGTFYPASFGHLMGYDASYYGYMWSEVFGDDMFGRFEDGGVTSPEIGMQYRREILEKGGTIDADEMLVNFLGRQPDNSAFLRKLGIMGADW